MRMPGHDGFIGGSSPLVVLHVSDDGLPALSIPSVHMTTVGSGSIAVPDFVGRTRTALEGGKTTLDQTRLAFHEPSLRPTECDGRRQQIWMAHSVGLSSHAVAAGRRSDGRRRCTRDGRRVGTFPSRREDARRFEGIANASLDCIYLLDAHSDGPRRDAIASQRNLVVVTLVVGVGLLAAGIVMVVKASGASTDGAGLSSKTHNASS